jgi:hypothetical protein
MESKSFQRKFTDNESFINGTSISHSSKQLLISTGCVSLDACIGKKNHVSDKAILWLVIESLFLLQMRIL